MTGEDKPTFSVVVVTYNRCNDLKECLDALLLLEEKPCEIIVVDSNSKDCTSDIIGQYPIKFFNVHERSMVKARNIGWQHAKGDIIAFVDDDASVSRIWSKNVLDCFVDESVGGVVGRVVSSTGNGELKVNECIPVGKVLEDGFVLGNFDCNQDNPIQVDTLIGCNMSFRRHVLEEVGGFDEKFRGNCLREDTDISVRVRKLGYKLIFHPKACVVHKYTGRPVTKTWFYWNIYNHTYFYLKNFKPITPQKFFRFLVVTLHPPAAYFKQISIRKTKLANKPKSYLVYLFLGLIAALLASIKGDPLIIEKLFRIE
jgi:GT2 family glycosyltransferase